MVEKGDVADGYEISVMAIDRGRRRRFVATSISERDAIHTFFAIIVPVGVCSTFLTLPPFPCPSSWISFKSSFFKSSPKFASVSESALWYVLAAEAVGGAEDGGAFGRVNRFPS